jgi:hypothetical protein
VCGTRAIGMHRGSKEAEREGEGGREREGGRGRERELEREGGREEGRKGGRAKNLAIGEITDIAVLVGKYSASLSMSQTCERPSVSLYVGVCVWVCISAPRSGKFLIKLSIARV